jgi:hypothetical protein
LGVAQARQVLGEKAHPEPSSAILGVGAKQGEVEVRGGVFHLWTMREVPRIGMAWLRRRSSGMRRNSTSDGGVMLTECVGCGREAPEDSRGTWYVVKSGDDPEWHPVCPDCWLWGPASGRVGEYIELDVGGYPLTLRPWDTGAYVRPHPGGAREPSRGRGRGAARLPDPRLLVP